MPIVRNISICILIAVGFPQPIGATTPATAAAYPKIPFVVGLSIVKAVTTPDGDYEALGVIESIDASGYRVVASTELPGDNGKPVRLVIPRKVLVIDQKNSRRMRPYFQVGDALSFPGTVPGFSTAAVNDLRTAGKASYSKVSVARTADGTPVEREHACQIVRVADTLPARTVLVNGREAKLPLLHAKGTCASDFGPQPEEWVLVDDPANPITVQYGAARSAVALIRIEYPEPKGSGMTIENALAKKEVAEIYGIYFSFNSADIRPESERVLKEIAGVLDTHPDWKLRVDGHTDGIGNDAANLDLSRRRASAVKDALVKRYGSDGRRLSTGGYGESVPQATNETPEGRARNRRVELRRE
jgi:outer membrane protein OmpA-like peptidoglycan-associated protein